MGDELEAPGAGERIPADKAVAILQAEGAGAARPPIGRRGRGLGGERRRGGGAGAEEVLSLEGLVETLAVGGFGDEPDLEAAVLRGRGSRRDGSHRDDSVGQRRLFV